MAGLTIPAMFDFATLDRGRIFLYLLIGAVVFMVGLSALRSRGEASREVVASGHNAPGLLPRKADRSLVVDVSGAVRRPGVYRFTQGSRVIDAIQRAGGPARNALATGLNRAALLVDGQQVVLPERMTGSAMAPSGSGVASTGVPQAPVALGMATASDLDQIEGIGPVTAGKIIEFRDSRGGLASVDDLDRIPGIGPATMETLRSAIQP